jgi:EAL and modified HD-GYP domain-containing signal transduction protein
MKTLLARQPIFDTHDRIAAYELLSREDLVADEKLAGQGAAAGNTMNGVQGGAGATVVEVDAVEAVLGVGLHRITDGRAAYITVSRDLLLGPTVELLEPSTVILQVPESAAADSVVVNRCRELATRGYQFALDDFTFDGKARALLEIAHIVKVDATAFTQEELRQHVEMVKPFRAQLLAENVQNRTVHDACLKLGFQLFQGYHFSRPETVSRKDLPVEHVRTLRLMTLVRNFDVADSGIEEAFRTDAALSYKLLRMVNSAAHGGSGLRSIGHAMRLLGREAIYRWLSLLVVSPGLQGDIDSQIAHATLMRARFCELVGDAGTRPLSAGTLFMIGLLSAVESFHGIPSEETVSQVELAPEVTGALIGRRGPVGAARDHVIGFEDGKWDAVADRCEDLGVAQEDLTNLYLDSLTWANERLSTLAATN